MSRSAHRKGTVSLAAIVRLAVHIYRLVSNPIYIGQIATRASSTRDSIRR
jgi:hypothetical protein